MGNITKSSAITETLVKEIIGGKYNVTKKLPSEHQLMRRFSVARETVRGALKELMDRKLVDKRPGYGTYLVDRASRLAMRSFGVIVPDAFHPFYARICRGIEIGAKRHGYTTLVASLGCGDMYDRSIKAAEFAKVCKRQRVSGLFLQPLQFLQESEAFNRDILRIFADTDIPVVLLDSDYLKPPRRSNYDVIGVDNTNIGYVLARHLIEAGAKRIVYFSNPLPAPNSLRRGNGAGIAVVEAGLKWTNDSFIFGDARDENFVKRVFSGRTRPDGVIAVNDLLAVRLVKTLARLGLNVPKDVRIAGVNGDEEGELCEPPLTTMVQPCQEIGETAVEMMCRRIANPSLPPREVMIAARLCVRDSTRTAGG